MSSAQFALGAADARTGRHYHHAYDLWDTNGQWDYERGRPVGAGAPRTRAISTGDKVTPEAVAWFRRLTIP